MRQRQENVRGVLAFLREVEGSTAAEANASMMSPAGSIEAALGACCRCVRDLSAEDEGEGGPGPSPFLTRVDGVVAALAAAAGRHGRPETEKEVLMQLLGCLYDVPQFGTRQYEGLLDPGGHREVLVQNATFMAAVKQSLLSVRGWLERSLRPVDMEGMIWYYTELEEKLERTAREALEVFCEPFMELSELPDALKEKIAGLVGRVADSPNTITAPARAAATGEPAEPPVSEDFLGSDNFFIVWKRLRELKSFVAFCDVLTPELLPADADYSGERERARMALKAEFTAAVGCIPKALAGLRKMRNRPDISVVQGEGTWLGKLQALARDVVYWNGGEEHIAVVMKMIVLLFDVPQGFFTGQRAGGEFGLHNSYTRVRDPGNLRHVFQNNKAFMTMVKDIARLNLLPVDFLSPRVEQYRALETQLLAKQQALIAELPLKYDSWRTGPEKSRDEPAPGNERAWLRCDGQMRVLLEELRGLGVAEVTAVNVASELTHSSGGGA
jgi:hypothetical protein